MENHSRVVLSRPVKPFSICLRLCRAVASFISETEADGVADVRLHRSGDKVAGFSRRRHSVASKRSFCNSPECVRVIKHVIRVFKIRIIEQRSVISKLLRLCCSRNSAPVAAARSPSGNGQSPLNDCSLSACEILMPVLMLMRHTASFRSRLTLRRFSSVIKYHKLIDAQILYIRRILLILLIIYYVKPNIAGIIRDAKFIPGYVLMKLSPCIQVSFCNRSLPILSVRTHGNSCTIPGKIQIGRAKDCSDTADTVYISEINREDAMLAIVIVRKSCSWLCIGKIILRHSPVTLFSVHISVYLTCCRQCNFIILFENFRQFFCIPKIALNCHRIHDRLVLRDRTASAVICIHLFNMHRISACTASVRYRHFDIMCTLVGHVHGDISVLIERLAIYRNSSRV